MPTKERVSNWLQVHCHECIDFASSRRGAQAPWALFPWIRLWLAAEYDNDTNAIRLTKYTYSSWLRVV